MYILRFEYNFGDVDACKVGQYLQMDNGGYSQPQQRNRRDVHAPLSLKITKKVRVSFCVSIYIFRLY